LLPSERLKQIEFWFARHPFSYTLTPPQITTVSEFLFDARAGFCAHYAAALTTILRGLEIPARVVVGYQGGELSLMKDYVIVRERDAHAWVEYLDTASSKWRRVDPTSWVAEERIIRGAAAFYEESFPGYSTNDAPVWVAKFFGEGAYRTLIRFWLLTDQIEMEWLSFLVRYDLSAQRELLRDLGLGEWSWKGLLSWTAVLLLLLLALGAAWSSRSSRERVPLTERTWRELESWLALRGFQRQVDEGPVEFGLRLQSSLPERWPEIEPVYVGLVRLRFGAISTDNTQANAGVAAARFKRLKNSHR
jgi:hypothetical protein